MKVKELIERLNALDPDTIVVIRDTGRYFAVAELEQVKYSVLPARLRSSGPSFWEIS